MHLLCHSKNCRAAFFAFRFSTQRSTTRVCVRMSLCDWVVARSSDCFFLCAFEPQWISKCHIFLLILWNARRWWALPKKMYSYPRRKKFLTWNNAFRPSLSENQNCEKLVLSSPKSEPRLIKSLWFVFILLFAFRSFVFIILSPVGVDSVLNECIGLFSNCVATNGCVKNYFSEKLHCLRRLDQASARPEKCFVFNTKFRKTLLKCFDFKGREECRKKKVQFDGQRC